jgi:hypothetical protein
VKNAARAGTDALGITEADKVVYNRNKIAEHEMSGRISNIDQEDGRITVGTDEANLELFFPKETVDRLKDGENVRVQLALVKLPIPEQGAGAAAENPASSDEYAKNQRAYDAPGAHKSRISEPCWKTGTIEMLDHDKGTMQVDIGADQTLNVHFPPQYTRDLDNGDRVAVEMALLSTEAQPGSHTGTLHETEE